MDDQIGRLANYGGKNHQQNNENRKKSKNIPKKKPINDSDCYIPKEFIDPPAYSRDPKTRKLLLLQAYKNEKNQKGK